MGEDRIRVGSPSHAPSVHPPADLSDQRDPRLTIGNKTSVWQTRLIDVPQEAQSKKINPFNGIVRRAVLK
jgi:hypothetical protein